MTEAKWLACADPELMLSELYFKTSPRKLRLFGVACVRRIWHLLSDERSRQIVTVAECYADALASDEELSAAAVLAHDVRDGYYLLDWSESAISAADAAASTVMDGKDGIFSYAFPITVCVARAVDVAPCAEEKEGAAQAAVIRDIFGNPYRPAPPLPAPVLAWNDGTVVKIAQGIYEERAFDRLPILHDALLDAGCDDEDILAHCRSTGPHVRGCWVIDLILGKE